MNFVAVDVETANSDCSSICQIGIVGFEGGSLSWRWKSLVNPKTYFDGWNVAIHGIDKPHVKDAPTFPEIFEVIRGRLEGRIVASHMPFDRVSLGRACEASGLAPIACDWLDTARVVRRHWPQYRTRGYGLKNVAADLGIEFLHHDAEEDARAAGEILLRAIVESSIGIEEWISRSMKAVNSSETFEVNPEGHLFGECILFTGALSITRNEASKLAAEAGCELGSAVTRSTTILVVGDQDMNRLNGHERSSKQRKAEELRAKGQLIRIVSESDFRQLLRFQN